MPKRNDTQLTPHPSSSQAMQGWELTVTHGKFGPRGRDTGLMCHRYVSNVIKPVSPSTRAKFTGKMGLKGSISQGYWDFSGYGIFCN